MRNLLVGLVLGALAVGVPASAHHTPTWKPKKLTHVLEVHRENDKARDAEATERLDVLTEQIDQFLGMQIGLEDRVRELEAKEVKLEGALAERQAEVTKLDKWLTDLTQCLRGKGKPCRDD